VNGDSNFHKSRGWPPFGAQTEVSIGSVLGYLKNYSSHELLAWIFGMKHPWDKEIQVCANKVPEVINGPNPRGRSFFRFI